MPCEWLLRHPSSPVAASSAIVAIPHAGGAPSSFRGLAERLGQDVALWIAQLPGRERRFAEAPVSDLGTMAKALAEAISTRVGVPFTFLGHSMGALLAYETARELSRSGQSLPAKLIAVVSPSPDAPPTRVARHQLPDRELLDWIRGLGNLPDILVADSEIVDQVLAVARADLCAVETYRFAEEEPLPFPVTAIAGAGDPAVSELDVAGWRRHTSAEFRLEVLPGGHFPTSLIDSYAERIRAELPGAAPGDGAASEDTIRKVTEIWEDVLGLSEIEADEDFFDLGGYSLIATTLVSRCAKAFGATVPVHLVFDHPVLADFAQRVGELAAAETAQAATVTPPREGSLSTLLDEFEQQMSAPIDVL